MRLLGLLLAATFLCGCPADPRPAASGRASSAPKAPAAIREPDPVEGDAHAHGYRIRPDKLERFIAYQEQMIALYADMMGASLEMDAPDGATLVAPSIARIRKHAEAQERLRRALGLTERDVQEMERMVGDVISRRAIAASLDQDESIRQMEALALRLPEEKRAEFDATIEALRKQHEQVRTLAEERKKYGDENVDLVLSREAELTRQWNLAIATFAGTREAAAPDAGRPLPPDAGRPAP